MPTSQPSNAPSDAKPESRDQDTAAAVLSDDRMDDAPGGGGLMGAGAGEALSGDAQGKAGAATPNSPINAELPHDAGVEDAAKEAEARVVDDMAEETHSGSG